MRPYLFLATLLLTACASLGLAPADTLDARIHYGYGTYTAVNAATAASKTAGTISKEDAEAVLKLTDNARVFLDSASTLENVDAAAAGDKLALATSVLLEVQKYINAHGGNKS